MSSKEEVLKALSSLTLPDGGDLVSRDMICALSVEGGIVRFVIEAPDPEAAARMDGVRRAAEAVVGKVAGISSVSAVLTAHGPSKPAAKPQAEPSAPPSLKIGGHPTSKRAVPSLSPALTVSWRLGRAKAALANRQCRQIWPSLWPSKDVKLGCLMQTSMVPVSRVCWVFQSALPAQMAKQSFRCRPTA